MGVNPVFWLTSGNIGGTFNTSAMGPTKRRWHMSETRMVQMIAIVPDGAIVQIDDRQTTITWSQLHSAQQQTGDLGVVYRHLMREYCRCEYEQRRGQAWKSPRLSVREIVRASRDADVVAAEQQRAHRELCERRDASESRECERRTELARVEAERRQTEADDPWWPIPRWEVHDGIRWDVLRRDAGQIVERAYGTFGRAEAGTRAPYMCVTDRSDGSVRIYRRRQVGGS